MLHALRLSTATTGLAWSAMAASFGASCHDELAHTSARPDNVCKTAIVFAGQAAPLSCIRRSSLPSARACVSVPVRLCVCFCSGVLLLDAGPPSRLTDLGPPQFDRHRDSDRGSDRGGAYDRDAPKGYDDRKRERSPPPGYSSRGPPPPYERERYDAPRDRYDGPPPSSRDRYDAPRDRYDGPRDRYDAPRDRYDAPRDRYDGPPPPPRDRYDGPRDRYDGPPPSSRDRYDAPRDRYDAPPPSRDRYDGPRDRYDGPPPSSRDRYDGPRDRYDGPPPSSRDRYDGPPPPRDRYDGPPPSSRDRYDAPRDRYRDEAAPTGSRGNERAVPLNDRAARDYPARPASPPRRRR